MMHVRRLALGARRACGSAPLLQLIVLPDAASARPWRSCAQHPHLRSRSGAPLCSRRLEEMPDATNPEPESSWARDVHQTGLGMSGGYDLRVPLSQTDTISRPAAGRFPFRVSSTCPHARSGHRSKAVPTAPGMRKSLLLNGLLGGRPLLSTHATVEPKR